MIERAVESQLVIPPVPCGSTSAGNLYEGLFNHPLVRNINRIEELLHNCCHENVLLLETDQATSNEKLIAHLEGLLSIDGELRDGNTIIHKLCCLHANSLVEGSVVAACGIATINHMYSACLMLKAGYFARLTGSDLDLVVNPATIRMKPLEPAQPDPLLLELKKYSVQHYKRFATKSKKYGYGCFIDHDPDDDTQGEDHYTIDNEETHEERVAVKRWIACWDAYLEVVNGKVDAGGGFTHHCRGFDCCNGFDTAVTAVKIKDAIAGLQYGFQPITPSMNKWTKLGPSVDWFMLAMSTFVLQASATKGFRKVGGTAGPDANLDPVLAKAWLQPPVK